MLPWIFGLEPPRFRNKNSRELALYDKVARSRAAWSPGREKPEAQGDGRSGVTELSIKNILKLRHLNDQYLATDSDAPVRKGIVLSPGPGAHYLALDGLRGVAILLVFIHHSLTVSGRSPVARMFETLRSIGWTGVTLFFVLSGFLIGGILLDSRGSRGYFVNFYMRRTLRIFPLYYGFLVGVLFLAPVLGHWIYGRPMEPLPGQFIFWTYLANYRDVLPACPAPIALDPLWSLAVEEQVYLVWPAFIAFCPRRWLVGVLVAILPASLAWRCGALALHRSFAWSYSWTPACLDAFAAGTLVAVMIRRADGLEWLRIWVPRVFGLTGAFLAGLWIGGRTFDFWMNATVLLTVGLTVLPLFFAALIAGIVTGCVPGPLAHILSAPGLRSVGRYSYAIYLFHVVLIDQFGNVFQTYLGSGSTWHGVPVQIGFSLVVFACAYGGGLPELSPVREALPEAQSGLPDAGPFSPAAIAGRPRGIGGRYRSAVSPLVGSGQAGRPLIASD